MGQNKKKIFNQMFLCLHGDWQRFVCQMQIVNVSLEYKVEGDRTYTEGLFQRWNWSRELKLFIECDVLLVANAEFQEYDGCGQIS